MNDTPMTRESLIAGIERFASCIDSFVVLRRVWKILDREYTAQGGGRPDAINDRDALRFYARHLSPNELRSTLDHIHAITGA